MSQQKPRDLFEELWQYQQGALFLKAENSSLEWKKSLADFFYRKGYESVLERIKELEDLLLKVKNCTAGYFVIYHPIKHPDTDNVFDTINKLQQENARLREALEKIKERAEYIEPGQDIINYCEKSLAEKKD